MKIEIEKMKKFNLEDGDIIVLQKPDISKYSEFKEGLNAFAEKLNRTFPDKQFLLVGVENEKEFQGIKVLHLQKGEGK